MTAALESGRSYGAGYLALSVELTEAELDRFVAAVAEVATDLPVTVGA